MKKLTKAEEEVMQYLWEHEPSTVSALIQKMPKPLPPHSTISSILRILEKKDFVAHNTYGRTHEYYSIIAKEDYSRFSIKNIVRNYFDNSLSELVSFLVKEEDLSLKELTELVKEFEEE